MSPKEETTQFTIRTRFAPSPTGYIHLGNVWVAFLNWWWTRQHGGRIVLRIEDIDRQRCRGDYVRAMMEDLAWLGLDWDEGPEKEESYGSLVQSRRSLFYRKIFDAWKKDGLVYPCYCTRARLRGIASAPHEGEGRPMYDGRCRNLTDKERERETKTPSWRLKADRETISFTDLFQGRKERTLLPGQDDIVLIRADGMMAYQLAATADDGAMGITHVFRGNDLLMSTFDQISLLKKLGYTVPTYGHLPLLVDADGVRLSKRQHGITVRILREAGKMPGDILGKLLFWAGAVDRDNVSIPAEEAVRNLDFSSCRFLSERHILAKL